MNMCNKEYENTTLEDSLSPKEMLCSSLDDAYKEIEYFYKSFYKMIEKVISEDHGISKDEKNRFNKLVPLLAEGPKCSILLRNDSFFINVEDVDSNQITKRINDAIKKVKDFEKKSSLLKTEEKSVIKALYELLKLRDDAGMEIKDLIKELLTDYFEVKFVDHIGEYANGDYFEYIEFKNLEKPETTLQALVSSKGNVCIAKGIRKTDKKKNEDYEN